MNLLKSLNYLNKRLDQIVGPLPEGQQRYRRSGAVLGQQARPKGKDAYNEGFGESKDDFTLTEECELPRSKINQSWSQI